MNDKTLFVVTAFRHGNREDHSYTVGVFADKEEAIKVADQHTNDRALKYGVAVESCVLNHFYDDDEPTDVYKTKAWGE